jgi:anti-sigma B factor antagonist
MSAEKESLVLFDDRGLIKVGTIRTSSVLSAANIAEFGLEVLDYIRQHPGINLILNFENVDFLSSAVLNELLRVNKAIQETQGNLRLCAVAPEIREVFEITNLDKVFTLHGDGLEADIRRFKRSLDIAQQDAAWSDPA